MNIRKTSMYSPEDAATALGLIEQTRMLFTDGRVTDALLALTNTGEDPPVENIEGILRAWRDLLPGLDSGDYLRFRITYGWTGGEIQRIHNMVTTVIEALNTAAKDVTLSGTATTLRRDSLALVPLQDQWWTMIYIQAETR